MFSTDKKSLLCIRCFRDMQGWVVGARREWAGRGWSGSYKLPLGRESRAHCVDLESAYVQGCERLEQAVLVRGRTRELKQGGGGSWEILGEWD